MNDDARERNNRRALGWHYPAGAEHDPRAPWNEAEKGECYNCGKPTEGDNEYCSEACQEVC